MLAAIRTRDREPDVSELLNILTDIKPFSTINGQRMREFTDIKNNLFETMTMLL